MSSIMERDKLDQMAEELAKGVTSEKDLSASFSELMKKTLEKALEAEMDVHLGYGKHEPSGRNKQNSRNGYSRKKLKTESGELGSYRISKADTKVLFDGLRQWIRMAEESCVEEIQRMQRSSRSKSIPSP